MNKLSLILVMLVASQGALASIKPNLYKCKGGDLEILYSTSGFDGRARFSVMNANDGPTNPGISASGESIKSQKTIVGTLVYAMASAIPDYKTVYGTLVIPKINLSQNRAGASSVEFKTTYFETTKKTSIAGPDFVNGLVEDSKTIEVTCTASSVYY